MVFEFKLDDNQPDKGIGFIITEGELTGNRFWLSNFELVDPQDNTGDGILSYWITTDEDQPDLLKVPGFQDKLNGYLLDSLTKEAERVLQEQEVSE